MIVWLFTSIWHALVGLILLSGVFIGAVVVIGRAIAQGAEHDQSRCGCVDCQRRRNVASKKRWSEQDEKHDFARDDSSSWISTLQLIERGPGTKVRTKGVRYELMEIRQGNGRWQLLFKNVANRRRTIATVSYQVGHRKYWKVD